jgi:hypothetical protein
MKQLFATSVLLALLVGACGALEPSAGDLVRGAGAKMRSASSVHVEGTGSLGMKGGFSMSFEFKLSGDVAPPDRSRMRLQTALFGQNLDVEMLTVGGKAYAKDPLTGTWTESTQGKTASSVPPFFITDPMGSLDLSTVTDVVEVDRPTIDGRKTRHLRYTADPAKLADAVRRTAGSTGPQVATPTAVGEVWIRVDDGQIVRQSLKVALEVDDLGTSLFSGALPRATASPAAKATFEMGFDFVFSKHGEPIPDITAPAVAPATPARTVAPIRTPSPQPTH